MRPKRLSSQPDKGPQISLPCQLTPRPDPAQFSTTKRVKSQRPLILILNATGALPSGLLSAGRRENSL